MQGYTNTDLIQRGIEGIFIGDKNALDKALKGQGWRYVAAAICIFPLTLIKVIDFLFRNKHLFHRVKETPIENRHGIGLSMDELKNSARTIYVREHIESSNDEVWRAKPVENNKKKISEREAKLSAISYLTAIFEKNVRLEGTILRTVHHRVSDKDLLESAQTGTFKSKFLSTKVTFGNDINASLKVLFPLLRVRKVRGSNTTFIDFENDEAFELEQKLRNTFMKPITIILKRKRNEK